MYRVATAAVLNVIKKVGLREEVFISLFYQTMEPLHTVKDKVCVSLSSVSPPFLTSNWPSSVDLFKISFSLIKLKYSSGAPGEGSSYEVSILDFFFYNIKGVKRNVSLI